MKNMYDETPEYLQRKARSRQNKILLVVLVVIVVAVVWFIKARGGDGYVGSWDAWGYIDTIDIWRDGTYRYIRGEYGTSGEYEVYDELEDIPDYYLSQIHYRYPVSPDSEITWLVLLDESGYVYEIGFYNLETDELRMGPLFERAE